MVEINIVDMLRSLISAVNIVIVLERKSSAIYVEDHGRHCYAQAWSSLLDAVKLMLDQVGTLTSLIGSFTWSGNRYAGQQTFFDSW